MKITIETPKPGEEDEIIIRTSRLDDSILKLINSLKKEEQLMGYQDDKIIKLTSNDVFYFESVDNKVFAYTREAVYDIRKKLYELEQMSGMTDFLRVSKSTIINMSKIDYVRPIFNGRFEAKLKNDEKIIISRQYVTEMKKKLGL